MPSVTARQTDGRHADANSRSYCVAVGHDRLKSIAYSMRLVSDRVE